MDVSLDSTLGCGQAHRWERDGKIWRGVLGKEKIELRETADGIAFKGCSEQRIKDYFRYEDDLDSIYGEISERDGYVATLADNCKGMRLLRQDIWECTATYVLATNANVKRIGKMVGSVCDMFGDDLGGIHSFPEPRQILDGKERISECRLGYRQDRFVELAEKVENGTYDLESIRDLDYGKCVEKLKEINGIGSKVADCVALFAYGHLEAFPIDARIFGIMEKQYGVTGSYSKVSEYGRNLFGRYAGYAQELLYHSSSILLSISSSAF